MSLCLNPGLPHGQSLGLSLVLRSSAIPERLVLADPLETRTKHDLIAAALHGAERLRMPIANSKSLWWKEELRDVRRDFLREENDKHEVTKIDLPRWRP